MPMGSRSSTQPDHASWSTTLETRILDAARRVFLERGLAGASVDEIASLARAGKPTIHARFRNKEALYAAVVMRNVASVAGRFADHIPVGAAIEERLTDLGATFLDRALRHRRFDACRDFRSPAVSRAGEQCASNGTPARGGNRGPSFG
jgi:AcrR family transcriptional regulator